MSLETFAQLRPQLGKLVVTSGAFDPLHPGHINNIQKSRLYGDVLAVIVNGDAFLRAKKGKSFQNLATRCAIVSAIRGVDFVIPFEIEGDNTVIQALEMIRPNVFTKGGSDRKRKEDVPEWAVCKKHKVTIITDVGSMPKEEWSSSKYLQEWEKFISKRNGAI